MKKEKTDSNEKLYWIIGGSLIVFLVLVLVSVIILRNTRDKIEGFEDEGNNISQSKNYVLENGIKKSINPDITKAEIDVDDVRFYNFSIEEEQKKSTLVDVDLSNISFSLENMGKEPKENESYIVTIYGENDDEIVEFTVKLGSLPVREPTSFRQRIVASCADAARIDVQKMSVETQSGE